jgi:hypothetical protein
VDRLHSKGAPSVVLAEGEIVHFGGIGNTLPLPDLTDNGKTAGTKAKRQHAS